MQAPQTEAPAPADLSHRVGAILDEVEAEAARIRAETDAESARILAAARERADALVAERQRRIAELSDELVERSEAVVARLGDAAPVREGFDNLVRALGEAAERLAAEIGAEAGDAPAGAAGRG
jgi:ElaB/YqjD/DUF883 family membrane-anchored ribosome-binding protein